MSSFSTFNPPQGRGIYPTFSIRPAWICRLADLAKLAGETHHLIGVANDFSTTENTLHFGIVTASELSTIESTLGATLAAVMDEGRAVRATSITSPAPQRLIAIDAAPVEAQTARLNTFGLAEREANAQRAAAAGLRFAQQREDALKLRLPPWSVEKMKHRADFVEWLPLWVCELISEESRAWLSLAEPPKNFTAPRPVPPKLANFSGSSHPTFPQTAGTLT
ncbi:MAG TPA: hypothetical protein VNT99_11525 [Methylomirabilota bacterium]|nr:hypothetical protein [Methylomirabilota bacterium]